MGKGQSKSYNISDGKPNKRLSQLPDETYPTKGGEDQSISKLPDDNTGGGDNSVLSPGVNGVEDQSNKPPDVSNAEDLSTKPADVKELEDLSVKPNDVKKAEESSKEFDKRESLQEDSEITQEINGEETNHKVEDSLVITENSVEATPNEVDISGELSVSNTNDRLQDSKEESGQDISREDDSVQTQTNDNTVQGEVILNENKSQIITNVENDTAISKEDEDTSPGEIDLISAALDSEEITEDMSDSVEAVVCGVDDLTDGEMREVDVGDGKALLVKEGEEFYAVGAKCTHYGAPLVKGVHCNGRVRCPWHGACFNVKTGDIEDFPGLDSIPKFEVNVSDGKVKVTAKKSALSNHKRQKEMCETAEGDHSVLIIGGGAASMACVETLRQEGFQGKITIATMEKSLPYDRPKLSKAMDINISSILLRDAQFYQQYNINVLTEKEVTAVDTEEKRVTFKDSSTEIFHSLFVATGGRPRVLPIPGVDLQNVCQLRTPEDANFIAENAKDKNVVIIGSSFIGMEVASFLADKAASVSVVDIIKVPFQLTLGQKVGSVLQKLHEEKGVKFHFESGIQEFVGSEGKVTEAVLSTGVRLPADLCVLGVGVVPATDFLKDSGIEMTNRGFIPVDKRMKTNKADVYAGGDIVEFPLFSVDDARVNIQHWQMAHKHGRTAALSILGKTEEIKSVPFFWTVQYGKSIRYTGYGPGYDDVVVHGDLDALKFVAYYTKGEDVVAVASLNFDPIVAQVAELIYSGKKLTKSEIQDSPDAWLSKL